MILFYSPLSLSGIFSSLILYSECYFSRFFIIIVTSLKKIPLLVFFSYLILNVSSATIVSIKVFLDRSMIVGNFIDVYLFGLIAVLMNWYIYLWGVGLCCSSFLLYLFLTELELFLWILSFLEFFSCFFQSLTLANRLSINLLAGSLLTNLLSIVVRGFLLGYTFVSFLIAWCNLSVLLVVFSFEILNSLIQLFIFSLLSLEYS